MNDLFKMAKRAGLYNGLMNQIPHVKREFQNYMAQRMAKDYVKIRRDKGLPTPRTSEDAVRVELEAKAYFDEVLKEVDAFLDEIYEQD